MQKRHLAEADYIEKELKRQGNDVNLIIDEKEREFLEDPVEEAELLQAKRKRQYEKE